MEFHKNIEAYLNQPWAIDLGKGFNAIAQFERHLEIIGKSPDFAKQLIQDRNEASRLKFYSHQGIQLNSDSSLSSIPNNSIAVVPLIGTMITEDGFCTRGIDHTCGQLEQARANPNIKGVILRTNSGGGAVTAAQRLYNSIVEFRQDKPIVQYIDGTSASGAVFAGAACNEIVGGGQTIYTGSVGVVSEYNKEWLAWMKENVISVYADQSGQKHEEYNALMNGDPTLLKNIFLNPLAIEFQKIVNSNRTVDVEHLQGRMYIAKKAKKIGLIDMIGTFQDAVNRVNILYKRRNRAASARKASALTKF